MSEGLENQMDLQRKCEELQSKLDEQVAANLQYAATMKELIRQWGDKQSSLLTEVNTLREILRRKESVKAATTIRELLSHEGEVFIRCAYLTVLGREAETDGLKHYLAKLVRGTPKLRIIGDLHRSSERKRHATSIPRLRGLGLLLKFERLPFIGWFVSCFGTDGGRSRQMNRIENYLAELQLLSRARDAATSHTFTPSGVEVSYERKRREGRQLLVDVSGIVHHDARTGIQRVVRSILECLLDDPPEGFTVEAIYTHPEKAGYFYAHRAIDAAGHAKLVPLHEPMEAKKGDVFLGLDFHRETATALSEYYQYLRACGTRVFFVVYDLLPVLYPHYFMPQDAESHMKWLKTLAQADGLIGISQNVANDIRNWMEKNGPRRSKPLQIGWFHLGADIENSRPSTGLPQDARSVLAKLSQRPGFLMVGTVEPRKGYAQVLSGFELLWSQGLDANLIIVGKLGWQMDSLAEKMRAHPERGKRFFWLENASDEYLEKIYASASCLIAASAAEGFGLPLIEAAQRELPLIVRDIHVFREVAGDHAFYFSGVEGEAIAEAVGEWLALQSSNMHPSSANLPWKSWSESKDQLLEVILDGNWHSEWPKITTPGNDDVPFSFDSKEKQAVKG